MQMVTKKSQNTINIKKKPFSDFLLSLYMITKMSQKGTYKTYYCEKCDYETSNKYDWGKHQMTRKHKMVTQMITNDNNGNEIVEFICNICNKSYKYKSGLSRHKKKCKKIKKKFVEKKSQKSQKSQKHLSCDNDEPDLKTIMMEFMQSQAEQNKIQNATIEMLQQSIENNNKIIPTIGNNNNNTISVNVFLNEKCKDAMNLKDFIQNLQVSIEDLMYTQEHGYVKGIENIFTKKLQAMGPTERPIHCSDSKRLQFYVKDEDTWAKDENHKKIDDTIHEIKIKQIKELAEWEKLHPNYMKNETLLHQWQKLVHEIMGNPNEPEINSKYQSTIKKTLANEISMKTAMKDICIKDISDK